MPRQQPRGCCANGPVPWSAAGQAVLKLKTSWRDGTFARGHAWTVALTGTGLVTDGVVLCNQVRTVDLKARRAQLVEAAPVDLAATQSTG